MLTRPFIVAVALAGLCHDASPQSRTCETALADHSVCEAANKFILHLMAERRLEAILDIQ